MSKEDLLRFQAKYGDEYSIEDSPIAGWILEHGWSEHQKTSNSTNTDKNISLKEEIKKCLGKPIFKAIDKN